MSLILWLFHLITSLRRGATPVSQNPPGMDISIIKPILLYDPFGCKLQSNFASDFGHHLVWVVHLSCYGTKKALTHVLVICQGHGGIRCAYSACFKRDRFCWSCFFLTSHHWWTDERGFLLLKCVAVYNWESYQPAKHFIAGYLLAAALKYGSKWKIHTLEWLFHYDPNCVSSLLPQHAQLWATTQAITQTI